MLGRLNLFKKYQPADTNDWKSQVQEVTQSQKPIQARVILYVIVVLFICLIIWAGFAKVDEITRGEGKVVPSQQMQYWFRKVIVSKKVIYLYGLIQLGLLQT